MECMVCYESLASDSLVTVSIPCGHLFHERCLCAWIQQQVSPSDGNPHGLPPDCPTCRTPLFIPSSSILNHVPKELRMYFHPTIRRVFLSGRAVDPGSEEATDFEIQQLRSRLDASEEAFKTAEIKVQSLKDELLQARTKTNDLDRQLKLARQREQAAAAEAVMYKQQVQRDLERKSESRSATYIMPTTNGVCFDFANKFPSQPSPSISSSYAPSSMPFPSSYYVQSSQSYITNAGPSTGFTMSTPTSTHSSATPRPKSQSTVPSTAPIAGPSLSNVPPSALPSTLPYHLRPPDNAVYPSGLLYFPPPPPQPPLSSLSNSQPLLQPASPPLPVPCTSESGSGSTHGHPSLAPPREWSHFQREKRLVDARTQSMHALNNNMNTRRAPGLAQAQPVSYALPQVTGQSPSTSSLGYGFL